MKLWNRINTVAGRVFAGEAREMMKREEGQTLVEYGLILGLITLLVIAAIAAIGLWVSGKFSSVSSLLSNPTGG